MRQSKKKETQIEKASKFLRAYFPSREFTAREVLEAAKPKSSPIHDYFDWEDGEAAEKWRLHQARILICSIEVEIDGSAVREYVSPVYVEEDKKVYMSAEKAMRVEDIWNQVLIYAMRDAKTFVAKYSHLKELRSVTKSILEAEKRLKKRGLEI